MGIEWREYLAINVEEIDRQHQELFRRFNELLDACDRGDGKEDLLGMLQFLDDYVNVHFRDEERLQQDIGFPDLEAHREEHRKFVRELQEIKRRFAVEGSTQGLLSTTNRVLVAWLMDHIARLDRQIGKFSEKRKILP